MIIIEININHKGHIKKGMNNTQIRLFVKIAESGSFTKAGLELSMTQPAVSRAISSLEAELDVLLLLRDRRSGLTLTDVGKRVLVLFREILAGFDKVNQEIAAEKGLEKGRIRIGAFPVAAAYFFPKIIRSITSQYPGIEIEMFEGSVYEVKEWLDSRFIDVGLILPPVGEFETFPLFREQLFGVLREDHPLTQQPILHIQELQEEPLLTCKAGYEPPVEDLFQRSDSILNSKYVVSNFATALNMVKEGLAIAIMSELSLLSLPQGVVMRELAPDAYRDIHIAVHSLEDSSIAVKLFIETALKLFTNNDKE
jgi:DNA-binding transcriptional LysR family regulator